VGEKASNPTIGSTAGKDGVILERKLGPTRSEESPFGDDLKPEEVNPNVQHLDPQLLQPMEMRIAQDRGADTRNTAPEPDAEKRSQLLMEKAQVARRRRTKPQSKYGYIQEKKPEDSGKTE
jgi:hypothetical protein